MKPQLSKETALATEAIYSLDAAKKWLILWLTNQAALVEPFCLALTLHVLMFPIIWALGWVLPWPKSPVITTVVEFELQSQTHEFKPKKVIDIRPPELNH